MKKNRSNFSSSFAKLAAAEEQFFGSDFLSPVLRGQSLRIRISNVVMNLRIDRPKNRQNFEGWGVFRALSTNAAKYVRDANMQERRQYLDLFPAVRFVVCERSDAGWKGVAAHSGDSRFHVSGLVPILLAQELQLFESVITRFDGRNFWHDGPDNSAKLRNAVFLREALAAETEADKLVHPGLTKEERQAYAIAFLQEIENKKDRNEEVLRRAIERAGAEYRSYVERGDTYTVEFVVDGERHQSVVKKGTLDVESAGICLNGGDRAFDLQSLVSVIRQGISIGSIVRVGNNRATEYDEDYD